MKNKRVELLCSLYDSLSLSDAKQVDELLMAYLKLDDSDRKGGKPIDYLFSILSTRIEISKTKDDYMKCGQIVGEYENSSKRWALSEDNFCIIAYVFTILSLGIEIFSFESNLSNSVLNMVVAILQFLAIIIALLVSVVIDKKHRINFSVFTKVFNSYIPSITILTLVFFYLLKFFRFVDSKEYINYFWFSAVLLSSVAFSIFLITIRFKRGIAVKEHLESQIDSNDFFANDIWNVIAPETKKTFNLIGVKLPTSQDIYFVSKWHEIHNRYQTARLFLRKAKEDNYDYWFNQMDDPVAQAGVELKIKAELFETALINYNILIDLTWTWTYVSAEYVLYKFDKDNNVVNASDITGMHTIEEAYELLRQTENGVTTPHAEGNPFNYLKIMRPEFEPAVDTIVDFWKEFSNSQIRNLYNFIKHKGKPRYEEIERLRGGKLMSISINGEQCPSDISDVEKIINLEKGIEDLIKFDDEKLFPYFHKLLTELKDAVDPSPMVF